MQQSLKLEFSMLLPQVEDEQDQCVDRLIEILSSRRGIDQVHIDRADDAALLCLHYDANLVSMAQVRRWAEQAGADITGRYRHESLKLTGMDCGGCAASIEHILARFPGIINVSVSYAGERIRLEYDTTLTNRDEIIRRVRWMGYRIEEEVERSWIAQNFELMMALLAGLLLLAGLVADLAFDLPRSLVVPIYILAYMAGGYHAAHHGLSAALKFRFDVDLLMVIAALGAAAIGRWAEGGLLLFLFSLGHALEHFAMNRARHAIQALGRITPKTARVRRDGKETELPVERLERGDLVVVRPGERIPIDGVITRGASAIDQSTLTGESVPVEKTVDDDVFAGTLNGDAVLEIETTRLAGDTTLARVVQLVEEAQTQKSPTQRFTEGFERVFVPVILVFVLLVIGGAPLVSSLTWEEAFLRAMTILVAASPCALAIATPSAILAGIAQAARHGVLIKGGVYLEVLGTLHAVALDKTGTVTLGAPVVTDVVPLENTEEDLLRLAAAVESRSTHPLARAVVQSASERGIDYEEADDLKSIVGQGVQGHVDGRLVQIGSLRMFGEGTESSLPSAVVEAVQEIQASGKTTMLVSVDGQIRGIIGLADRPREDARSTLDALRKLGIRFLIMLTGDHERVAKAIAEEIGLTDYRADLLPEEKVAALKELLDRYGQVAMVGDGVNDAPALAIASVGIAMGASGSDVALETADIALMADDLSRLPFAVALSREARRIIRQNLVIALGVILVLVPFALFGWAGIGIAIVFHEGSTLVVVANALRLLRFRPS